MKVTIDRFEGEYAILEMEDKQICAIPKILVANAKEKDVIIIEISKEETKKRQDKIERLMNKLFK